MRAQVLTLFLILSFEFQSHLNFDLFLVSVNGACITNLSAASHTQIAGTLALISCVLRAFPCISQIFTRSTNNRALSRTDRLPLHSAVSAADMASRPLERCLGNGGTKRCGEARWIFARHHHQGLSTQRCTYTDTQPFLGRHPINDPCMRVAPRECTWTNPSSPLFSRKLKCNTSTIWYLPQQSHDDLYVYLPNHCLNAADATRDALSAYVAKRKSLQSHEVLY